MKEVHNFPPGFGKLVFSAGGYTALGNRYHLLVDKKDILAGVYDATSVVRSGYSITASSSAIDGNAIFLIQPDGITSAGRTSITDTGRIGIETRRFDGTILRNEISSHIFLQDAGGDPPSDWRLASITAAGDFLYIIFHRPGSGLMYFVRVQMLSNSFGTPEVLYDLVNGTSLDNSAKNITHIGDHLYTIGWPVASASTFHNRITRRSVADWLNASATPEVFYQGPSTHQSSVSDFVHFDGHIYMHSRRHTGAFDTKIEKIRVSDGQLVEQADVVIDSGYTQWTQYPRFNADLIRRRLYFFQAWREDGQTRNKGRLVVLDLDTLALVDNVDLASTYLAGKYPDIHTAAPRQMVSDDTNLYAHVAATGDEDYGGQLLVISKDTLAASQVVTLDDSNSALLNGMAVDPEIVTVLPPFNLNAQNIQGNSALATWDWE